MVLPDSVSAEGRTPYIHHFPSSSLRIKARPDRVIPAKKPSPEMASRSVTMSGWSFSWFILSFLVSRHTNTSHFPASKMPIDDMRGESPYIVVPVDKFTGRERV